MKNKATLMLLLLLLNSCVTATYIVSDNYTINNNFELAIHTYTDAFHGVAYFNGEVGKYVVLTITVTNNDYSRRKLDFKNFTVVNSITNFKIPLYSLAMSGTNWQAGGSNKTINFNGKESRKLRIGFITPKEGELISLYYEDKKIKLKFGDTKQVLF